MNFSIFDLYVQPPLQLRQQRGPYEFTKKPERVSTRESTDSFIFPETPPVPVALSQSTYSPTLGSYQTFLRKSPYGLIAVVRRKAFAPIRLPDPIRLPQHKAKPRYKQQDASAHHFHSYMENRRHWDIVYAKDSLHKAAQFPYQKSKSLHSFPPETSLDQHHFRRSLTKSQLPDRFWPKLKRKL